jgi:predicted lipoprotein with Yx(FWY)xxD motif
MRRLTILFIATAAAWLPTATQATTTAHAGRGTKLEIRHTSLGSILTNGRGLTLYMFTRDPVSRDRCVAISGCTSIWPVLASNGRPAVGSGVRRSLVGTIKLPDGARQLTYAGHPLYTYIGDSGPGDTSYVGQRQFGGTWFALGPGGRIVK